MATQTVKFCENCQEFQFQEWKIEKDSENEPTFSLICLTCGSENPAEPPINMRSHNQPKEQRTLL